MLPFENLVADYVNNTGNHVLYRVTPMFSDSNLVANGVLIEAKSVEDNGGGIMSIAIMCSPVGINYENGDSWLDGTTGSHHQAQTAQQQKIALLIPQTARRWFISLQPAKYHRAGCRTLKRVTQR